MLHLRAAQPRWVRAANIVALVGAIAWLATAIRVELWAWWDAAHLLTLVATLVIAARPLIRAFARGWRAIGETATVR